MDITDLVGDLILNKKKQMTKYSFSKGLGKGVLGFVLFAVPMIIDQFIVGMPDVANLTLGGLLIMGFNWVKFHYKQA